MNQRVADATQQAASSVHDRRASIVQEVSEAEHEGVSTRILANYNHMHALTVQYFEVVEIYRVLVDLHRVERCLFVPMKLIDFTDALIQRYRGALAEAALDRRARELLTTEYGVVRVSSTLRMSPFPTVFGRLDGLQPVMAMRTAGGDGGESPGDTSTSPRAASVAARGIGGLLGRRVRLQPEAAWDPEEVDRIGRLIATTVLRPGRSDLSLPDEADLVGMTL